MKDRMRYHRFSSHLRNMLVLISVAALLPGCSEDLARELFSQRTPIKVSASVGELSMPFTTRTVTTGLNNGAFTISETAAMNKVLVHIGDNDHTYTFSGTAGDATTELIEDETTYFPKTVSSVNVYGHYPYSDGFTTVEGQQYFTIQQNQTTDDGYLKSDLMTADNSPAVRSQGADGVWTVSDEGAHLDFKHQMAKIIVNVKTDESTDGGSGLTIKRVVINDVKPRVPVNYNATTGEYTIGAATTDAADHTYDLEVLGAIGKNEGEATVLIPSQRYKVPDNKLTDYTVCQKFITIYATAVYKDANQVEQTDENAELTYFFKGNGKLFKPGYVYTVTLRPGKNDYLLKDEYNVPGVELAKWADDGEKTNVHVIAAEEKLELAVDKISTAISDVAATKVYTGHEHTLTTTGENPELTISLIAGGTELVEGDDYELHYSNNVNVGTATVTIMGIGRYAGNLEQHFEITPKNINDETVSVTFNEATTPTYDGSQFQPTPTIFDSEADKELTRYDYTTTNWTGNVNAGESSASVTITGTGNYTNSRTENFSINKTAGSVTFADEFDTSGSIPTLTLIKPHGHEFDYIDAFKDILGDGKLATNGVTSSDNSVLEVTQVTPGNTPSENKWKFHVKKSGTVTLTFTMTNKTEGVSNYDYTGNNQPKCKIVITPGPALPIEYVSEYDIGSFRDKADGSCELGFAADYKSSSSCWLSWSTDDDALGKCKNRFLQYLSKYGIQSGGVQYHLPSTNEWRSIFPGGCITVDETYKNYIEGGVAFGTSPTFPRSTGVNVDDYTYGIKQSQTGSWYSDYYNEKHNSLEEYTPYVADPGTTGGWEHKRSTKCYAIRYKGTTYCSAWLYEHVWTVDGTSSTVTLRQWGADATDTYSANVYYGTGNEDTRNLTKNSIGRKSCVVRVIYLGPTVKEMSMDELKSLPWNDYDQPSSQVIIRRFPLKGINSSGTDATYGTHSYNNAPAMEANAADRPYHAWYWSGTPAPPSSRPYRYKSVRMTQPYIQGDQAHESYGFSVRMFKNYVE